jgi:hypothetical protein
MLSLRNKFLWSILHVIIVRSDHNKGLGRINLLLKPILIAFELGRLRLIFLLDGHMKTQERRFSISLTIILD